jgi:FkbM family methyltransferase
MDIKKICETGLDKIEEFAIGSRLNRFRKHPFKYIFSILYRKLYFPFTKKEITVTSTLFFGKPVSIALPSATDIYLAGGKTHSSEIRLARFFVRHINSKEQILDIGAHYGYFTLLAGLLAGEEGMIFSYEPSGETFRLLQQNCENVANIKIFQQAVSEKKGSLKFYQFPNLYSEYNTTDVSQFENEGWYKKNQPTMVEVETDSIDRIVEAHYFLPGLIKIDVEGAEYSVLKGGETYFKTHSPLVIMEYLSPERSNTPHQKAVALMKGWGYATFIIETNGTLNAVDNIDEYLKRNQLDSDNIVFKK